MNTNHLNLYSVFIKVNKTIDAIVKKGLCQVEGVELLLEHNNNWKKLLHVSNKSNHMSCTQ